MIRLGITGGIGSGKSVVSHLLRVMGIPVYDSDSESKRLTVEDADIREQLVRLVGSEVYAQDGSLCKPVLASWLFSSEEHTVRVNGIIHPVVKKDFLRWAEEISSWGQQICAIESAILFEARFEDVTDAVIVVSAPLETRIERTMRRDGASREAVLNRISRQMDDAEKVRRADFVVDNGGGEMLIPQLCGIIASLLKNIG